MNTKFISLFIALFITQLGFGQSFKVSGTVQDQDHLHTVPYANVWVQDTYRGVATNIDGHFSIDVKKGDTLCISSIGYEVYKMPIQESFSDKIFLLQPLINQLNEVRVRMKEDYAKVLFRRIQKNKKATKDELSSIDSLFNLNRITIYLALDSTGQNRSVIRDLEEVSILREEDNLRYVPIFLSEEEAHQYSSRDDEVVFEQKEGVFPTLNQTIEGIITQYLVIDLDIYRNNIFIFGKTLPSPISSNARLFYNFFVNDSTIVKEKKYYQMSFAPKDKRSSLFTGSFMVDSEDYSIKMAKLYVKASANINFVDGFQAFVNYERDSEDRLYLEHQNLSMNLSIFGNAQPDSTYASDRVNDVSKGNWLLNKQSLYHPEGFHRIQSYPSDSAFAEGRGVDGSQREMIQKLKQQPALKAIDAIGGIVLTGYLKGNYVDVGPVYSIYSNNAIEGNRFSLPVRTNENLFEYFTFGGFVGYGVRNEELQFGTNVGWQPLKRDQLILRLSYEDDYNLVSQDKFLRFIKKNPNTKGNGNFISAITTQEQDPYLKKEKNIVARVEYHADNGFNLDVEPYFSKNTNTPEIQFVRDNINYPDYYNYGVLLNTRIAFNQYYDKEYFARIYYLSQTPIINVSLDLGKVSIPDYSENLGFYWHLHGSVQGIFNIGIFRFRYMVNGGYLHGDAPYANLEMAVGACSWGYSKYNFNLLDHAAYAHNLYTNVHVDWTGGGLILNKIPLIRSLQLREMISIKAHYGTLTDGYKKVFDLPLAYQNELTYPYAELGLGFSNIFKVLRVEYIRQLGNYYKQESIAIKEGVRLRAELSF